MKPIYLDGDLRRPGDYRGVSPPPASVGRSPYTHDTASEYGRIVHSMAFRRLQGKMQLFPPNESPLLRNRLTHTLEVADIATNIAKALNDKSDSKKCLIDGAFVATAALAHDLGHPPFGHSGELVLNRCMKGHGGFEGNAQSLRIITRLENRFVEEFPRTRSYKEVYKDPLGLNLLYRTIAATIKYDVMIPSNSDSPTPVKGYYQEDKYIVESVKRHVLGDYSENLKLRTIENQIMDIADDIAYSTYDLEDCMICGVVNPVDLMAIEDHIAVSIRDKVNGKLKFYGYKYDLDEREIITILYKLFDDISRPNYVGRYNWESATDRTAYVGFTYKEAKSFGINPLYRRRLTETLIRHAVNGMTIESWNEDIPCLTKLRIKTSALLFIEVLKAYNYIMVIQSPRLQIYQKRACDIVQKLFTVLYEDDENTMLSLTAREQLDYQLNGGNDYFDDLDRTFKPKAREDILQPKEKRRRFICDHIASLTDAEAIDLYAKITSSDQRTIFGIG